MHSGFNDSSRRMHCDQKSMMRRSGLDFCLPRSIHHYQSPQTSSKPTSGQLHVSMAENHRCDPVSVFG